MKTNMLFYYGELKVDLPSFKYHTSNSGDMAPIIPRAGEIIINKAIEMEVIKITYEVIFTDSSEANILQVKIYMK